MIKFVVFDFDGVFSNGDININKDMITYNVKDGYALKLLRDKNIKTGCISSFNFSSNIYIKEPIEGSFTYIQMNKREILFNHLKFNKFSIGKSDKLVILDKWLNEFDILYDEVAYIGDDLTDIEIMKKVGFSACPKDAVEECKTIVDYICNKKGGECCVREFVDFIINKEKEDKTQFLEIIKEIKHEFNGLIHSFNKNDIIELCHIIHSSNNIYIMGVGKSGNIASHFADLLKSISYSAFSFNILNSTHGDLGSIKENDIAILFSNSGNTEELIHIIPFIKQKCKNVIGICSNKKSTFSKLCTKTIIIPSSIEINSDYENKTPIDKIPTNSCMCQLIFSNIVVSLLKTHISLDEYKLNHLSGHIGHKLSKVKDVLITEFPKYILNSSVKLNYILMEMTKYKIGCCFFVNEYNQLLGILTDGDIRRLSICENTITEINENKINKNYYQVNSLDEYLYNIKQVGYIPVVINNKLGGIIKN